MPISPATNSIIQNVSIAHHQFHYRFVCIVSISLPAQLTSYGHTRRGVTVLSATSQALCVHRLVFSLKTTRKWIAFHSSSMSHPFTRLSNTWVDSARLHTFCIVRLNVFSLGCRRDSQSNGMCVYVWTFKYMTHTFENKWNVLC